MPLPIAGHKSTSPDLLAAVARSLTVDAAALTRPPHITELCANRLESLVRPMREALDVYDLNADPAPRRRSLPELVAAAVPPLPLRAVQMWRGG